MDLAVADVRIRVDAPERVIRVLDATLFSVPRFSANLRPQITVEVSAKENVWEITDTCGERKVLSAESALPRVAGAVVSSIVNHAALIRKFETLRATVVELHGRALAMIGDDWESAITLAAHLHARGWKFLSSDNALLESSTRKVHSFQKSLYVNASSLGQLPSSYRRAVEASPWYVTQQGISFYAVDPSAVGRGPAWSDSATLCGILFVDGSMADSPSLEPVRVNRLSSELLAPYVADLASIDIAELRIGGNVETCDLIEHWFGTEPS